MTERRRDRVAGRAEAGRESRVQAVERIPPDLREIAISYHVDGMTCDEISTRLGVSPRTIGNRLMAFQCEASGMTGHA